MLSEMSWSRVVWFEPEREQTFSDAVPTCWIVNGSLYWPNTSNYNSLYKSQASPNLDTWKQFSILKIKQRSNSLAEAKACADSSDSQTDEVVTVRRSRGSHDTFYGYDQLDSSSDEAINSQCKTLFVDFIKLFIRTLWPAIPHV